MFFKKIVLDFHFRKTNAYYTMKKKLYYFFLILGIVSYAQVPSYYTDVNLSLAGQSLFNELANKITATHTSFLSYTPGVWDALKQTDLDPLHANRVLLIYGYDDADGNSITDRTRGINNNGGGSTDWNREHTYPKSLGNPNLGTSGPGADAHHLRPADVQRNSLRGSRKFADGSGNSGITAQGYWYPGDEWKGDIARIMMYMYLRYGNVCLPVNVAVGNPISADPQMIDLFLQWNVDDPVSDFELQRNLILEGIQGNRNPFIDNPAFATQIWGGPQAEDRFASGGSDTEAPSPPNNLISSNTTSNNVTLNWNASTDNVGVTGYDIFQNTVLIGTTNNISYTVSGLSAATSYTFIVKAKDIAGNVSPASNSVTITTDRGSGSGTISELIISEYVEGSSYNKAIEIANYTGSSVDLSQYNLKKQTNGSGSWNSTLTLSGSLAHGETFVIVNGSADTILKNKSNLQTGATVLSFNGNDAVGLFKGNSLVDVVGIYNGGSANFAKDQTLRRKATVLIPSLNFIASEWDSYPQNTFEGLGRHNVNGIDTEDITAPTTPANLKVSNSTENSLTISWDASSDNVGVAFYNIYQDYTFVNSTANTSCAISGLSKGRTYIFSIIAYDAANNASAEATITASIPNQTLSYCGARGNNASYEFIDYVGINEISNATGSSAGYADYSSQLANLQYGSNTITFSAGFSNTSYTEHWAAWIDFNQNGTFESTEQIVSGSSSSSSHLFSDFTVPQTASLGITKLRVSMKWNAAPTACETFNYGEVEDYTVNIGSSALKEFNFDMDNAKQLKQEIALYALNITPNPAKDSLQLSVKDNRTITINILNLNGRVMKSVDVGKKIIDVSDLRSGIYIVSAFDGTRKIYQKLIIE